jgi:hypothetical protein
VIIGGGPVPESNEVSLEQDVDFVRQALPGPGVVLFAAGGEFATVRELAPEAKTDSVRVALGDLFAPRSGRGSRYRAPHFDAEAATLDNVEHTLSGALAQGTEPLFVYIAGHGDQGQTPAQNSVALWGGGALTVANLATLHEGYSRPLRLVATTCFSGGFADLVFAKADASAARPAPVLRCGVFAGTADRETSGCDPNPNRRARESYGLHLTHALSGQRKDGSKLPLAAVDFNHDGQVGLLDAHTWARIEAVSFDLPTTTSERWLRAVEPGSAPIVPELLPEDAAVVQQLGAALGLSTETAAQSRWQELDDTIADMNDQLDGAEDAQHAAEDDLGAQLLERWPVLDDPYHPDFESTLKQNEAAIGELLFDSDSAAERNRLSAKTNRLYERFDEEVVLEARILRVLRAYETLHKAAALHRRGGPAARYYEQLLACERAGLGK